MTKKQIDFLEGVLLCVPVVFLAIPLLIIIQDGILSEITIGILLYVPMILGLIYSKVWYKNYNQTFITIILIILGISALSMIKTYIFSSDDLGDIGSMFLGLFNYGLSVILCNIYYLIIAGWRNWIKYIIAMASVVIIILFVYIVIFGAPAL